MKKLWLAARRFGALIAVAAFLLTALLGITSTSFLKKDGGRYALTALADDEYQHDASDDWISIRQYDVVATVQTDRKIFIDERITVEFLTDEATMFYKSLPIEGDRFYDIQATCEGLDGTPNEEFSLKVADNPDLEDFFDINCKGGVKKGAVWVYHISYVMEIGVDDVKNGMRLDLVGFGTAVPIYNVTATLHLPRAPRQWDYLCTSYGSATQGESKVAVDNTQNAGKTLIFTSDVLRLGGVNEYGQRMAEGITVEFIFTDGVLEDFTKTRILTEDIWKILLGGTVCVLASFVTLFLTKRKNLIIPTVNVKAPDDLDPLQMGKMLDGAVDTEDVTSMIYYFAHQGYLSINLEDEKNPILLKKVAHLPDDAPIHEKTLFNGLFASGDSVCAEDLAFKFYEKVEVAKLQLPAVKMYQPKSVVGYLAGGLIGGLFAFLTPMLMAVCKVGGGYVYPFGFAYLLPIAVLLFSGFLCENYRYKWKKSRRVWIWIGSLAFAALMLTLWVFTLAHHIMTEYEMLLTGLTAIGCTLITSSALSRREEYCNELGQILGFKDFIVYTEEDKIKEMLEINPELYYKVLPYAQVLGVTNEWENKFASLVLTPPAWCVGSRMTVFDYMLLHRCVSRSMASAMQAPRNNGGVGRSGGGGSFGGFGGGGHGGGGFGAR